MRLESYRKASGLSLEALTAVLGLKSKGHLSDIEREKVAAPLALALRIERWSDGAVRADELVSPRNRELLKDIQNRPPPATLPGAARLGRGESSDQVGAGA